jgi:hypothetical protein
MTSRVIELEASLVIDVMIELCVAQANYCITGDEETTADLPRFFASTSPRPPGPRSSGGRLLSLPPGQPPPLIRASRPRSS